MKDIIVFMDLTKMDKKLLKQILQMDQTLHLGKICLAHYMPLQNPEQLEAHFPGLDRPVEDIIHDEIEDKLEEVFSEKSRCTIRIFSKGGSQGMVDWVNNSEYEICVLGKKAFSNGSGVFARKLARLTNKSVLFISELLRPRTERILVPVDFSEYSRKALKFAAEITKDIESELFTLHVFKLHTTYFPYLGEFDERHIESMRKEYQHKLDEFTNEVVPDRKITGNVLAVGTNIGEEIYRFARSSFTDLIITGNKGSTDDHALLIGTVSQYLIQSDKDLSVLLVK